VNLGSLLAPAVLVPSLSTRQMPITAIAVGIGLVPIRQYAASSGTINAPRGPPESRTGIAIGAPWTGAGLPDRHEADPYSIVGLIVAMLNSAARSATAGRRR
jgi:hypothetical protein